MTMFLLIAVLVAVIAVIGVFVVRARSTAALPPDQPHEAVAPPPDIFTSAMASDTSPPEPEPVEQPAPPPEPEVVPETAPPMEPEPVVEPLPEPEPIVEPLEPEPVIEPTPEHIEPEPVIVPEPEPVEPEPVIEPDSAGVGPPPERPPGADPDEPTPPPQAVIDAGEMPAQELDPNAGWEADSDRTIHADPESGLYHTPDSPGYQLGPDGQVFQTEEEAQSAGFTRWDEPDEPS